MLTDVRRGQRSRAELVILRKTEQVFANTRKTGRWLSASNLLLDGVPLLLIGSREGADGCTTSLCGLNSTTLHRGRFAPRSVKRSVSFVPTLVRCGRPLPPVGALQIVSLHLFSRDAVLPTRDNLPTDCWKCDIGALAVRWRVCTSNVTRPVATGRTPVRGGRLASPSPSPVPEGSGHLSVQLKNGEEALRPTIRRRRHAFQRVSLDFGGDGNETAS